ncbi:MAG: 4Fe-4S binding protein [Candidatus Diapherotrites archaeon]|nr:4Fe-4S binding protein [Candidatus Diapherotrites archaeon]
MGIKNDSKKCLYCGGCVGLCPVAALKLDETRIVVDNSKCINCNACVLICPVGANVLDRELKK